MPRTCVTCIWCAPITVYGTLYSGPLMPYWHIGTPIIYFAMHGCQDVPILDRPVCALCRPFGVFCLQVDDQKERMELELAQLRTDPTQGRASLLSCLVVSISVIVMERVHGMMALPWLPVGVVLLLCLSLYLLCVA